MTDKKLIIREVVEWIYCIVIAIVLALLIRYFIGTPTIVRQSSMYPTLKENQRLILNRIPRTFNQKYERGDIITLEAPKMEVATKVTATYDKEFSNWLDKFSYYVLEIGKTSFIKRIVALPGEHVQIYDGKIHIDGEELPEEYLQEGVVTKANSPYLQDFVVPEGYVFAVGDNREKSTDCREFGCIPIDKIESKVFIRFWPLNLFGTVD